VAREPDLLQMVELGTLVVLKLAAVVCFEDCWHVVWNCGCQVEGS